MNVARALTILAILAGQALGQDTPERPAPQQVRASVARGIDYLLASQNKDGSWGGPAGAVYTFTGPVWSNPETHRTWKVGTTGLCAMTLYGVLDSEPAAQALDRAVSYLLDNAAVHRPSEWDTMNCWAYIYGLQALATVHGQEGYADPAKKKRIKAVGQELIDALAEYQTLSGGWGYLEFDAPRTERPQWATSFTTPAGVVALQLAKERGFDVPDDVLARAVRGVKRCKLPNGAWTYSIRAVPHPRSQESINNVKGSLSRIQVCQLALRLAGEDVSLDDLRTGLDLFFEHHRFLDAARNRPIPHEAYYQNSGYFYLFGHYYAAMVIQQLPPVDRAKYWPKLQREVVKIQQKDGSMWDYDMHRYHKPYGASFGVMTLQKSLEPTAAGDGK